MSSCPVEIAMKIRWEICWKYTEQRFLQDKGEFGSVSGKIEVDLKINHEGEV